MNSPFSSLIISELLETIHDGSYLLQGLEEILQEKEKIIEMIRLLQMEVNKINDIQNVLIMLKHQAWKLVHWDILSEEMYRNVRKPDFGKMTLRELLKDNLLSHSALIYKIASVCFSYFFIIFCLIKIFKRLRKKIII